MKIAMPYQDGVLLEHFGRAKEFIIYNVSDLDPVTSELFTGKPGGRRRRFCRRGRLRRLWRRLCLRRVRRLLRLRRRS